MSNRHPFELTVPLGAEDHVIGPAGAPVTLVEYGDFECPTCKQAAPLVKMLLREAGDRIRFAYRHFPLREVHTHAFQAAEAAEAAGAQDRFWEMHDQLFAGQLHLTTRDLVAYAETLGLDPALLAGALRDGIYRRRIETDLASGLASGARATPTFFVNGKLFDVSGGVHALYDGVLKNLK